MNKIKKKKLKNTDTALGWQFLVRRFQHFLLPPRPLRVKYLVTDDQPNTPFLEDSNMKAECLIGNDEDGRRHSGSTLVHESFYNRKHVKGTNLRISWGKKKKFDSSLVEPGNNYFHYFAREFSSTLSSPSAYWPSGSIHTRKEQVVWKVQPTLLRLHTQLLVYLVLRASINGQRLDPPSKPFPNFIVPVLH